MKHIYLHFGSRSKACISYCLIVFVATGLFLVYLIKSEKIASETALTKQSLEQTTLKSSTNQDDTTAGNYLDYLHKTNIDYPKTDQPKHHLQSLQFAMQRDANNVTFTDNPNGSRTAFLNGTFSTVTAAKRLPDGTLTIRCFEDFEALEDFMDVPKKE